MVDPDLIGPVKRDSITSPDVPRIQVSDGDVLNDDIADTIRKTQSLALDHTTASTADQRLVGADFDRVGAGIIISHLHLRRGLLEIGAPIVGVDGKLAARSGSPGRTAGGGRGSLGAREVEGLGQDNCQRIIGA